MKRNGVKKAWRLLEMDASLNSSTTSNVTTQSRENKPAKVSIHANNAYAKRRISPLPGIKDNLGPPRYLTKEEIDDCVSVIFPIPSLDTDVANWNNLRIKERYMEYMAEDKWVPDIKMIKDEILYQYEKSLVCPGEVVGGLAAESLGGTSTQMTLNSFHQAGFTSKQVNVGFNRIRELADAVRKIRAPSLTLHFINQPTLFDISRMRPVLDYVVMEDIIKDYVIDHVSAPGVADQWWHPVHAKIYGDVPKTDWILRLYINVDKLVEFRLHLSKVAEVIESKEVMTPGTLRTAFSPTYLGIIDVYTNHGGINDNGGVAYVNNENYQAYSLRNVVLEKIYPAEVCGIESITKHYPAALNINSLVVSQKKVDRGHLIKLRRDFVQTELIRMDHVLQVISRFGLQPEKYTDYSILIPTESMNKLAADATKYNIKADQAELDQPMKFLSTLSTKESSPYRGLLDYRYVETDGTNLLEAFTLEGIDPYRSISNSTMEILDVLDVEAARMFLLLDFMRQLINNESFVDKKHLLLYADFMSFFGKIVALTRQGMAVQNIGPLIKASFEETFKNLMEAGAFGLRQDTKGATSAVFIGKMADLGANMPQVLPEIEELQELENIISGKKTTEHYSSKGYPRNNNNNNNSVGNTTLSSGPIQPVSTNNIVIKSLASTGTIPMLQPVVRPTNIQPNNVVQQQFQPNNMQQQFQPAIQQNSPQQFQPNNMQQQQQNSPQQNSPQQFQPNNMQQQQQNSPQQFQPAIQQQQFQPNNMQQQQFQPAIQQQQNSPQQFQPAIQQQNSPQQFQPAIQQQQNSPQQFQPAIQQQQQQPPARTNVLFDISGGLKKAFNM
jgi:hypothetical protein